MYKCIDTLYFVGADGKCSGACTVIYAIYNKYITLNFSTDENVCQLSGMINQYCS